MLLLAADLLIGLRLRGLLRPGFALLAALALAQPAAAQGADPAPALATRLAFVATGDAALDEVSRQGLVGPVPTS
jgi:hypothetical protein